MFVSLRLFSRERRTRNRVQRSLAGNPGRDDNKERVVARKGRLNGGTFKTNFEQLWFIPFAMKTSAGMKPALTSEPDQVVSFRRPARNIETALSPIQIGESYRKQKARCSSRNRTTEIASAAGTGNVSARKPQPEASATRSSTMKERAIQGVLARRGPLHRLQSLIIVKRRGAPWQSSPPGLRETFSFRPKPPISFLLLLTICEVVTNLTDQRWGLISKSGFHSSGSNAQNALIFERRPAICTPMGSPLETAPPAQSQALRPAG